MRMVSRIAKLLCAALLAAGCFAQTTTHPQTRDITLMEGRGELDRKAHV